METVKTILTPFKDIIIGAIIVYFVMDMFLKPLTNFILKQIKAGAVKSYKAIKNFVRRLRGKYNLREIQAIVDKVNKGKEISKRERIAYEEFEKSMDKVRERVKDWKFAIPDLREFNQ